MSDLLFCDGPASVADIAPSVQHMSVAIGNTTTLFKSTADFELSVNAWEFVVLLKVYRKPFIEFTFNNSVHLLSHCCECNCVIVAEKPEGQKHQQEDKVIICAKCQRRQNYYDESQGNPSSHATYKSLVYSPMKR